MTKRTGPTREKTKSLAIALERKGTVEKAALWKDIARRLSRPSRIRTTVNLTRIARLGKKMQHQWLLVPGKVLGGGTVEKPVRVIALDFSKKAAEKIIAQKGKAISIRQAMQEKIAPKEIVIVE